MSKIFNDIFSDLGAMLPNITTGIIVIIIFILLGKLFYYFVGKRIQRKWKDSIISNFVSEATKWAFYIFGLVIALNIIGFGGIASSLIAGAGISAIIFGFAFKDIGENFLAGIILALKRPFEIGDIIEVEGHKGNVRDLDLRITHLRNVEGKDIYIPNSSIIKNTLINYTKDGFLRINFMIGIAPECSIDKTRNLILDYLAQNKQVLKSPAPNVIVQELGEFTTDMQVLFWVDILANKKLPDSYLGHNIRSKAITDIKEILDTNNIELPSQVIEHKMYRDNTFDIKNKE
ncbi:MAG: mechanosensitive ion channel family protein [Flavobacteriaceae bacterium]|nr:mechanosensitive ion channel family protein [Flavobacteriaceae bacterium]